MITTRHQLSSPALFKTYVLCNNSISISDKRKREMVNMVEAQKTLLQWMMKMAGVSPQSVEVEPGTVMSLWVPSETLKQPKPRPRPEPKPTVVLIHGFAAEGIVTWQFQVGALTKKYRVYVVDLLFFGGSTTDKPDRTPAFQAECVHRALKKVGVGKCAVVGFSYGGMVAFKLAEMYADMVETLVVSGSVLAMTESISQAEITRMGFSSSSELLLPETVKGLKTLLNISTYSNLWFPEFLHKQFLKVMFTNKKERSELLDSLVITNRNYTIPSFPQRIHLLWGEDDQFFGTEHAQNMKEQLGEKVTYEGIKKAGHLVHLERPCAYNKCLKRFLDSLYYEQDKKKLT